MEPHPEPDAVHPNRVGDPLGVSFENLLGLVGLSADTLLACIGNGIKVGSRDKMLGWGDFSFSVSFGTVLREDMTVTELFVAGMPILDAVVWYWGKNRPASLTIDVRPETADRPQTATEATRGLFCWFFSIYSQGCSIPQGTPNFLINVLDLGEHFTQLITGLTTANIGQFPIEWVVNVPLPVLSDKAKNRLALGAAGHRYLTAISYITDADYIDLEHPGVAYLKSLVRWTGGQVWWELHPVTKSGQVITATGSLNKNIQSAMKACVSEERLKALADSKVLHAPPIDWPSHSKWKQGAVTNLPRLRHPIFRAEPGQA